MPLTTDTACNSSSSASCVSLPASRFPASYCPKLYRSGASPHLSAAAAAHLGSSNAASQPPLCATEGLLHHQRISAALCLL